MTDSLTIPYQYKVLLLGLFSYTSCSVIAGALLLGLLSQTLVVTTFLAIVLTLIYEHRIRKTTHLKNSTETPLLLPLITLTRHGWTANEKATMHASLLTGPLYVQQLQYRTAPMGNS